MARDSKEQMIEGAIQLLATKGLQATSFSEVLALTGTPRCSIYHHFPKGKNELIAAALDLASQRTLQLIETKRGESARGITEFFLDLWRKLLVHSQFQAGCSVLAVTIAADSDELHQKAATIFDEWQKKLTELYIAAGVDPQTSARFLFVFICPRERAGVFARAQKNLLPFQAGAKKHTSR